MGCFVVWRRMAYFGDTMAHSALLGVAVGFLLGLDPMLGVGVATITVALVLVGLQRLRPWLPLDTVLGILAHAALSFGLVAVSLMVSVRVDLLSYLFGDILAVTSVDLAWVWGGGALVLGILLTIWRPLLATTVHPDLARAEGTPAGLVSLVFTLMIAIVVALAMKIVGILLITSLLIIPAATARRFVATPEAMAAIAAGTGVLAVVFGLALSSYVDAPSGPSIVVAAALIFVVTQLPWPRRQLH
ncbi:MAG: metal ABC transporter permease [Defluviicoccus sp.]|nr:MAG: metal ABC transporter permease [Defluviicoccus sp.]